MSQADWKKSLQIKGATSKGPLSALSGLLACIIACILSYWLIHLYNSLLKAYHEKKSQRGWEKRTCLQICLWGRCRLKVELQQALISWPPTAVLYISPLKLYSAHPPPVLSLVHHPHRWTPAPSHSLLLQQNGRGVFVAMGTKRWHLAWSIRDVYTPEDHVFCQCQCNIQGHLPAEAEKVCRVFFCCDFIASSPGPQKQCHRQPGWDCSRRKASGK